MALTTEQVVEFRERRVNGESYESLHLDSSTDYEDILRAVRTPHETADPLHPVVTDDDPWKEQPVMAHLYHSGLFFTEMSDVLNCHPETVRLWITRHRLYEDDEIRQMADTLGLIANVPVLSQEQRNKIVQYSRQSDLQSAFLSSS